MFGGIVLLLVGLFVSSFSVYMFKKPLRKDESADEKAQGIVLIFIIGVALIYAGADQIDSDNRPEPTKVEQES